MADDVIEWEMTKTPSAEKLEWEMERVQTEELEWEMGVKEIHLYKPKNAKSP